MKKFVLFFTLLVMILGVGFLPGRSANSAPLIQVEFPSVIGTHLEKLPIRVTIPNPNSFGYPRVPTEISVALAGFRNRKVTIPLLERESLFDPQFLSDYLNRPIEVTTELPIPIHQSGNYRIVVDVKCLYGPRYKSSHWYSYTPNKELQILYEKVRIVAGPEIKNGKGKFYGYTLSQSTLYDFLGKGVSYRFRVQVIDSADSIQYEEPAASLVTTFQPLTQLQVELEMRRLEEVYSFLLERFPGRIEVHVQEIGRGDWRFLFSTQPPGWIERHGIVIEAALPTWEGKPFFAGLDRIEWPGLVWDPWNEFQLRFLN